jgi:hypothetical protein
MSDGKPAKGAQVVRRVAVTRFHMSDYRDPNDLYGYEPADRTGIWGWIAGAVGLVIILSIGLGLGRGRWADPCRVE